MFVTKEFLLEKGACGSEVERFAEFWPHGVELTYSVGLKALGNGFDLVWFAYIFLSCEQSKLYREANVPLWKAYEEANALLWKAYEEANASLWKAYEKAKAPFWKAYEEANALLWKAYEEANAPLWKAYEEACLKLLCEVCNK